MALTTEKNPLDANLEAVLPGLQVWHSENKAGLTQVKADVKEVKGDIAELQHAVSEGFQQLQIQWEHDRSQSDHKLASHFLSIANQLLVSGDKNNKNNNKQISVDLPSPPDTPPARQKQYANDNSGDDDESPEANNQHRPFMMVHKHKSLSDLYDEWHGIDAFHDELGGVKGRNETFGKSWRKDAGVDAAHYSRTARAIQAIECFTKEQGFQSELEAVATLEPMYSGECRHSVANFVRMCQAKLILPKAKPRGRKSKKATAATLD